MDLTWWLRVQPEHRLHRAKRVVVQTSIDQHDREVEVGPGAVRAECDRFARRCDRLLVLAVEHLKQSQYGVAERELWVQGQRPARCLIGTACGRRRRARYRQSCRQGHRSPPWRSPRRRRRTSDRARSLCRSGQGVGRRNLVRTIGQLLGAQVVVVRFQALGRQTCHLALFGSVSCTDSALTICPITSSWSAKMSAYSRS